VIPTDSNLSPAAIDLLKRMITDSDSRLGRNGADEIKVHPFFEGIDWNKLKLMRPPYIPNVASEISAENFDKFDEEEPFYAGDKKKGFNGKRIDMNFIGYTYKGDVAEDKQMLLNILKDLDTLTD
jgi:serine/threonine kinase 38